MFNILSVHIYSINRSFHVKNTPLRPISLHVKKFSTPLCCKPNSVCSDVIRLDSILREGSSWISECGGCPVLSDMEATLKGNSLPMVEDLSSSETMLPVSRSSTLSLFMASFGGDVVGLGPGAHLGT